MKIFIFTHFHFSFSFFIFTFHFIFTSFYLSILGLTICHMGQIVSSAFVDGFLNFFVHNFTCSHIPEQRGQSIFLDLDWFRRLNCFILIQDLNSYKAVRWSFLNRQIIYSVIVLCCTSLTYCHSDIMTIRYSLQFNEVVKCVIHVAYSFILLVWS